MSKNLPVMARIGNALRFWRKDSENISHPAQLIELMNAYYGFRTSVAGVKVSPSTVLAVAAVYACVRVISESLAMCPFRIFQREADGSRSEAVEHPIWRLVSLAPNFFQTPMEFIEMLVAHLLLRGRFYCFKVLTKNPVSGVVMLRELLPLHPDRVEVKVKEDYSMEYWVTPLRGGVAVKVPSELILHLRGLSLSGFEGMDPLSAVGEALGNAIAAQEYNSRMFKQGARLSGVLSHPGQLDDEAYDRIKKSWSEAYQGIENAFKVAIIEEGMTWKEISMTADQLQLVDSRKLNWVEVCGIFRVAPSKIMFLDKAGFATLEQQDISFVRDTLQPWATRIEQKCNRDLLIAPQKYYFKFMLQALMRGDAQSRAEYYASGITNGWLNRNEVRAFEELNRGPTELDAFLEPLNMAPAGEASELRRESARSGVKPGGVGSTTGSNDQPRNKPTSKKEEE